MGSEISAINTALQGLQKSSAKIYESAEKLANFPGQSRGSIVEDQVDFSEEAVNILQAEVAYKANLEVIETTNELTDELLDTLNDDE